MSDPFGQEYAYFSEVYLTSARSVGEAAVIATLLKLTPGTFLLDIASGSGRIATALAARRARVVGIDSNFGAVTRAVRAAVARRADASFVQADMRELPFQAVFDCAVSWYSSFGLLSDIEIARALHEIHRCLKRGGLLLLDNPNRDFVLRNYHDVAVEQRNGNLMIDLNSFDPVTSRTNTTRVFVIDGQVKRARYFVRLFTYTEVFSWLDEAGFDAISVFGAGGEAFSLESPRMLVVASKGRSE